MEFKEYSTGDIKAYIASLPRESWEAVSQLLMADTRAAVRKMGEKLQSNIRLQALETSRLQAMRANDELFSSNARVVCGVDEAGRGPLAGPVVAGAVILPPDYMPWGLNDSKKVPELRREALYEDITTNALAWGVGIVYPPRIDEINILEATREAMLEAIKALESTPDFILLDAVEFKDSTLPHKGIIKGDEKCLSIAAASILAKVTRDRMMKDLAKAYPQYGFDIHKGYGTAMHYEALKRHGLTAHHRRSFLKNWQG